MNSINIYENEIKTTLESFILGIYSF